MVCDCGSEMVRGEIEVLGPTLGRGPRVLVSRVPARTCLACGARVVAPEVASVIAGLQVEEAGYGREEDVRPVVFRWEVVQEEEPAETGFRILVPSSTWSTGDIATRFGISIEQVRRLCDEGALPCKRVGKQRRIPLDCLRPAVAAGVLPRPADWLSDEEYEAKLAQIREGKGW